MRNLHQGAIENQNQINSQDIVYSHNLPLSEQPEKEMKRSPRKKIIIGVSSGIVAAVVIIVVAVVVTNKKDDNDDEGTSGIKEGFFYPIDDPNNLYPCSLKNCAICYGYIRDNYCTYCKSGNFPLYSDETSLDVSECKTNTCNIGSKNKCFSCSETEEGECSKCNNGFFLPTDATSKSSCTSCSIKNCKSCSGTSSSQTCSKCEDYASPDSATSISTCTAVKGDGAKCKEIDSSKNECSSCNVGYKLDGGKCVPDYDIIIEFKTRTNNENVKLIDKYYPNVKEMVVDGLKLTKPVKSYSFESKGTHSVYYNVKEPIGGSIAGMFEGLKKMTSISFSEKFDFQGITKMDRMFYNCQNLKSVDISNIKSENVKNMNYMFYQCLELNSVDISDLEASKVTSTNSMFENCVSLNSIDISSLKNPEITGTDMFAGISSSGTIKVNSAIIEKINSLKPSSEWTITQ